MYYKSHIRNVIVIRFKMRNSICFIFATDYSNHIPSKLKSCSTVQSGHILLPAGTFIFATCSSSFGSGYPKITIGSSYNSIVSSVRFTLHKLSNFTQSARLQFQRGSESGIEIPIFKTIGK